ncbi:hypothetical protein [Glycomyces sp. NPDC048151]|uniref:hypothetical protein n=1 Tax=Glycomyces sp. NPDC048151 TaxID=3364002 RepID=UPI00371BDC36
MTNRTFNSANFEDAVNLIRTAIERVTDPGETTPGDALWAIGKIIETASERTRNYQDHLADVDGRAAGDRVLAHLAIARMTIEVASEYPIE